MSKAVAKKVPTPKPVVVEQVCDICDEDWDLHPENPTVMDCLEILKAKRTKVVIRDFNHCCGHGHSCCYHWHTHVYTQPQWTYTPGIYYQSGNTTSGIAISPRAINATNTIMDTASAKTLINALNA